MKRKIVGNHTRVARDILLRCQTSGKACYPNRKTARTAINATTARCPLFMYKCADCHFWHLTKNPQRW